MEENLDKIKVMETDEQLNPGDLPTFEELL